MEYRLNNYSNTLMDEQVCNSNYPLNSLSIMIPLSYMTSIVELTWNDIYMSFMNGYITIDEVISFALMQFEKNQDDKKSLDIACLSANQITREELICEYLEYTINESDFQKTKSRLLYIVMSYVFEKRSVFEDPLQAVEVIYSDFNYPPIIEDIVRFMQVKETDTTLNETEILIKNWEKYLKNAKYD